MACSCPTCGQALPDDDTLRIDDAGIVVRKGAFALLAPQEAAVLGQLQAARGNVVSKERLLASLYRIEADEADIRIIDVYVCRLRKKLSPLGVEVGTVWGRGYRLVTRVDGRAGA